MKQIFTTLLLCFFLVQSIHAQSPETVITTGHSTVIGRISISPAGNLVATCSNNHLIKIWDTHSGKEICTLNNKTSDSGNDERIENIYFFDDGKHLLTADENGKINTWNIAKEKPTSSYKSNIGMPGTGVSVVGNKIVFFSNGYKLSTAVLNDSAVTVHEAPTRMVALNPANKDEVFLISLKGEFYLYNLKLKKKTQSFNNTNKDVLRAHISTEGNFLAILHSSNTLRIWDMKKGTLHKTITGGRILDLGYNHSTGQLAVLHQYPKLNKNIVKAYNKKTYEPEREVSETGIASYVMTLSANGLFMALNTFSVNQNSVDLINWNTGKLIKNLHGKAHAVDYIGAVSDAAKIVALSRDMNLRIWDLSQMQIERIFPFVLKATVNNSGKLLAFQGYSEKLNNATTVRILTLDSLKEVTELPVKEYLSDIHFSGDDKHIIMSSLTGKIEIWNINDKKLLTTIKGKTFGNTSTDISPDLKYAAVTASGYPGITIHNLKDKSTKVLDYVHPVLGASEVRFSSDGKYLLSGSFDTEVMVWETGTWKLIEKLNGNSSPITSVCFDTENKGVSTASRGSSVITTELEVCAWNIENGKLICRFIGHAENVLTSTFCFQKNLLFSGSEDGTIKIWDLEKCREVATCTAIG